jgi:DNA polymerase III beta subunit, N-terminal domain
MSNFVTIEGSALKRAMTIIRSVIERHNTIPILSHVKLTHSDAGLRIVGTDLDMEIGADLDVAVSHEMTCDVGAIETALDRLALATERAGKKGDVYLPIYELLGSELAAVKAKADRMARARLRLGRAA